MSSEFNIRQKKLFDQLVVLENNRKNFFSNSNNCEISCTDESKSTKENNSIKEAHQKRITKHFQGKESLFKRPQNPAPKNYIKNIPDFKKNPHKWTKYSLEEVQDVTEESNKKSAMDFLRELTKRKNSEETQQQQQQNDVEKYDDEHSASRIVFKKKIIEDKLNTTAEEERATFKNSKLIMPEYVIGQKTAKKSKKLTMKSSDKGKQLKLDHLLYEDDDDEINLI